MISFCSFIYFYHDFFKIDFDQLSTLCDKSPSYFLFRKDDNNWMVIIFIPDASKVSEKLVYAATTSPLKNNLGYQFEEFSATSPIVSLKFNSNLYLLAYEQILNKNDFFFFCINII